MRVHRDSVKPLYFWFPRMGVLFGRRYIVWGNRFWWFFKNKDGGDHA